MLSAYTNSKAVSIDEVAQLRGHVASRLASYTQTLHEEQDSEDRHALLSRIVELSMVLDVMDAWAAGLRKRDAARPTFEWLATEHPHIVTVTAVTDPDVWEVECSCGWAQAYTTKETAEAVADIHHERG